MQEPISQSMGEGLEQHKSDVSITAADEIRSGLKGGDGGPEPLPQTEPLTHLSFA